MIFQDKNATRIAVAMGSTLDFSVSKLQDAFETVMGGGCVEIYMEIAKFANVAGAILDEIDLADNNVSFPGVYDYEVAEKLAMTWQVVLVAIAATDLKDKEQAYGDMSKNLLLYLGKMTYDFFNQDGQITEFTKNVILKHTKFSPI